MDIFFCVRTLAMLFISRQRNGNYLARVIMDLLVLVYTLQYFVAHYFSVLLVFHPIVLSQWKERQKNGGIPHNAVTWFS